MQKVSKVFALSLAFAALLLVSAAALAEKRPHEGKIVRLDPDSKTMTVAGETQTWFAVNVSVQHGHACFHIPQTHGEIA